MADLRGGRGNERFKGAGDNTETQAGDMLPLLFKEVVHHGLGSASFVIRDTEDRRVGGVKQEATVLGYLRWRVDFGRVA